jgi:hypothetical protein
LGIARNIAHSHGGEVSLQNLREGGLRVTLQLPRTLTEGPNRDSPLPQLHSLLVPLREAGQDPALAF